jgi:2-iminoacetate synthase
MQPMHVKTAETTKTAPESSRRVLDALEAAGLDRLPDGWPAPVERITGKDVEHALGKPIAPFSLDRLATFVSPAAGEYLHEMAVAARDVTLQRFGRTVQMYAPLYVSSYCVNRCRYCAFNRSHEVARRRLSVEEALEEAESIRALGFRDLLLVSGEDPAHVTAPYLTELVSKLRSSFDSISVEIAPLEEAGYRALFEGGAEGVTLYQETYDREAYPQWHPTGPKASYEDRLRLQEGAARAGMRRLGIGALLGLSDWRYEALALGVHARALMRHYWRSKVSVSFPRIRQAEQVDREVPHPIGDRELTQLIMAMRLTFPDAGLVLSTREPPRMRDQLLHVGITQISAGSRTTPGGYAREQTAAGQFEVADLRPASEIARVVEAQGYEPVWKDWDAGF